jgi:predicted O-linked N-acetylglucosamine transferase (SPINDLY family)
VPQSRLTLKHGALRDAGLRERLVGRFTAHGVASERIQCLGPTSRLEHLAAYDDIDICLDPFPMNGGVSTWEALQVGVPVLAKLGNSNGGRAGGAILCSIGLNDWVVETEAQYIEVALKHAAQPQYLAALRTELPGRIEASASGNTQNYTRAVEQAYRTIWREYCAKRAAASSGRP